MVQHIGQVAALVSVAHAEWKWIDIVSRLGLGGNLIVRELVCKYRYCYDMRAPASLLFCLGDVGVGPKADAHIVAT